MTATTIDVASQSAATSEVNMNMRSVLRTKIFKLWCRFSDPIKDWFEQREIGSDKSRKAVQDAFGYCIFAACWVGVTIALQLGFKRSLAAGAAAMFVTIVVVEYVAML